MRRVAGSAGDLRTAFIRGTASCSKCGASMQRRTPAPEGSTLESRIQPAPIDIPAGDPFGNDLFDCRSKRLVEA